jgi:hypothetical protein
MMRKLSRNMPARPAEHRTSTGACLLTLLVIAVLGFFYPIVVFWGSVGLILIVGNAAIFERRWRSRIAAARAGQSICTFARSFDRRSTDFWIIRAVYEELAAYFNSEVPILAADRFEDDLQMDWEDLDDLAGDMAARAGRSMEHTKSNPLFGKVKSVRDLVLFLSLQPEQAAS